MTNLTIDDYYIVESYCCRMWPVVLGFQLGRCGLCHEVPIIKEPLVVIRPPKNAGEE
jgi:hypothetical protein